MGGGDDSGVSQQIALEQQEYNDQQYEIAQKRAQANDELLGVLHAQSGPLFTTPPPGEVLNPEKGT